MIDQFAQIYQQHYSGMPVEDFLQRVGIPSSPIDYESGNEPFDPQRLASEVALVKDSQTSKKVIELPQVKSASAVMTYANKHGLAALKGGNGRYYLYDPKQITRAELKDQIDANLHGESMGYGPGGVPVVGVDYAIDHSGQVTTDLDAIKQMRDTGMVAFAGRAPSMEAAHQKMAEMGAALARRQA